MPWRPGGSSSAAVHAYPVTVDGLLHRPYGRLLPPRPSFDQSKSCASDISRRSGHARTVPRRKTPCTVTTAFTACGRRRTERPALGQNVHHLVTRAELVDRLTVLLAGRAAGDLVFQAMSTGAQDDLARATRRLGARC